MGAVTMRVRRRLLSVALLAALGAAMPVVPASGVASPHDPASPAGWAKGGRAVAAAPWVAALVDPRANTPQDGLLCGATLVAPRWLLTAGHCVADATPKTVVAHIGAAVLDDVAPVTIRRVVLHHGYAPERTRGDVALLELDTPASAEPARLAGPADIRLAQPGSTATLYGWGAIDPRARVFPDQLQASEVDVSADAACRESFAADPNAAVRICAGRIEAGACTGDSGGPLIAVKDETPVLVGLVSAGEDPCGSGALDEYVEVAAYQSWIARVTGLTPAERVARIDGTSEEAAIVLSRFAFPAGHPVAFVATSSAFADGLAGGALAAGRGPLLLTPSDRISPAVLQELKRLSPRQIVVFGGSAAINPEAVQQLERIGPTMRIAGANRYATAAAVAREFPGSPATVFVATGENFPDALAAVPVAFGDGPVLLTARTRLPAATLEAIARLDPLQIVVLGGEAAISESVEHQLSRLAVTRRVAGEDRYGTAAALATDATAFSAPPFVFIVTGREFADALAAGVAAASLRSPILLADGSLGPRTRSALITLSPDRVVAVGSAQRVSHALVDELGRAVGERLSER